MFRIIGFSAVCALVTVAAVNAGQIKVGGASGITAAYVGGGSAALERSYAGVLFPNETQNGVTPTFPSVSLTDPNNNVSFAIMNDSGNNYYALNSSSSTPVTVTVPVGVFGVTDVYTLLNDYWGVTGAQNTTVVLNFGNSATVTNGIFQTFVLTNGTEIRDATDCTGVSTSPAPGGNASGFPTCTGFARTASSGGTSQAFSTAYNGDTNQLSQYANTSGNLVLDDQDFRVNASNFGSYLVSVQISNVNGGNAISRTAVSAITVATPEPASIALSLGGLTALMLLYSRRRRTAVASLKV